MDMGYFLEVSFNARLANVDWICGVSWNRYLWCYCLFMLCKRGMKCLHTNKVALGSSTVLLVIFWGLLKNSSDTKSMSYRWSSNMLEPALSCKNEAFNKTDLDGPTETSIWGIFFMLFTPWIYVLFMPIFFFLAQSLLCISHVDLSSLNLQSLENIE